MVMGVGKGRTLIQTGERARVHSHGIHWIWWRRPHKLYPERKKKDFELIWGRCQEKFTYALLGSKGLGRASSSSMNRICPMKGGRELEREI